MSSWYHFCEVLLRKFCGLINFRILFIEKPWIYLGSLDLRRTPRVLLGSHLIVISILGGWRKYGRVNGRTPHSWKRLEFFRSSHNMLLMPASPTSSQMSVDNTKSSQTSLFKALLSYLVLMKWVLIYMLKTIRYHLLNFVTYAWSLLMGA